MDDLEVSPDLNSKLKDLLAESLETDPADLVFANEKEIGFDFEIMRRDGEALSGSVSFNPASVFESSTSGLAISITLPNGATGSVHAANGLEKPDTWDTRLQKLRDHSGFINQLVSMWRGPAPPPSPIQHPHIS